MEGWWRVGGEWWRPRRILRVVGGDGRLQDAVVVEENDGVQGVEPLSPWQSVALILSHYITEH